MRIRAALLLILIISSPIFATAAPDFDPASQQEKLACLFAKPFIFGASISAGYSGLGDGTAALAKFKTSSFFGTDPHYLGSNPDPIARLAQKYNSNSQVTNIAEIINQMQHSAVGADQFLAYITKSPENYKNAQSSSVLASIDGLYWPTIYGDDCSWTEYAIERTRSVIQFANENQIPILLGSVPDEDPSKVSTALTSSGSWAPPKPQCVRMVKEFLRRDCRIENQCYVLDLHTVVENLKGSHGPHDRSGIWYQGKDYAYNDFRKDGVHLNGDPVQDRPGHLDGVPIGMKFVMTYIEKSIAWNLKSCK